MIITKGIKCTREELEEEGWTFLFDYGHYGHRYEIFKIGTNRVLFDPQKERLILVYKIIKGHV